MTNEERLDWLCRLRSFIVSVNMPDEWRDNFNEALSISIDYRKAIEDIKIEMSQVTDEELSNYWHKRDRFLGIVEKHIGGK